MNTPLVDYYEHHVRQLIRGGRINFPKLEGPVWLEFISEFRIRTQEDLIDPGGAFYFRYYGIYRWITGNIMVLMDFYTGLSIRHWQEISIRK